MNSIVSAATKIEIFPKHPAHNEVFDNKYMKLFDVRPSAIHTFGLPIKQFLTASILTVWKHINILSYHLGVSNH